LVASAILSDRYITDRFLPDKAIDLVDEAQAGLRMEIDSMPYEIDEIERRMMQLQIEITALSNERDAASQQRCEHLQREVAELREQADELKAQWQAEKDAIAQIRSVREQIEDAKIEIERSERMTDLARAAELRYGTQVQLEQELARAESILTDLQRSGQMLKEEVRDDDVAEVVAKWTGIPVARLLEGEVQNSSTWKSACTSASSVRTKPLRPWRTQFGALGLACRIRTARLAAFSFLARRAWAKQNLHERWRSSCLTTSRQ
jgi:ATP-dependent Clp protease ATP-binding subunit ClpB